MFTLKKIALAIGLVIATTSASSADLCKAIALRDVAAIENPDSILKRGNCDVAITQYRVDKRTGITSFCSHGEYCYPTHLIINGKKTEVLRLITCKIGKAFDIDNEKILYSVDVVRSKNTSQDLRRDDLDNRFLEMGLCSACASNVAKFYLEKPSSRCAKLAKQALEGNPIAIKKLQRYSDYCNQVTNHRPGGR